MIRYVFFDRDGTLGDLTDVRYPQTLTPFCDIKAVFLKLQRKGLKVGILSNQSSIARGTGKDYDFDSEFLGYGADIWEICPHDDSDGCDCRKPKSGLLLRAAKRLGAALNECIVVGDRITDVACAKDVGANAALVLTGKGEREKSAVLAAYPDTLLLQRFDDLKNHL